jgi:hypothetical protein
LNTDFVCFKIAKHNLKFYIVTINVVVDVQTMFLAEFLGMLQIFCGILHAQHERFISYYHPTKS